MTVTYLPHPSVTDEQATENFEYIESHAIFDSSSVLQTFLQLLTATNVELQFGTFAVSAPNGVSEYDFTLPNPWGHNHYVFLASACPASSLATGDTVIGSRAISLTQGAIQINSVGAQVWNANYISLGN